jgi:hypothetical protein
VFSTAHDSTSIISTVSKWWTFSFIFNQGNGMTVMLFLVKNSQVKKRKREMVHCCDYFVVKVQSKVFAHFHTLATKCHNSMLNDYLVCQDELFVNNPLDVKGNDQHALDFALHLSRPFRCW